MNTFELTRAAGRLAMALEDNGGALTEEGEATLDAFIDQSGDKLSALFFVKKAAEAKVAEAKELEAIFKAQKAKHQNTVKRVKALTTTLLKAREELGEPTKVAAAWGSVWLVTKETPIVLDVAALEEKFKSKTITWKADLKAIKDAMKIGAVEGVTKTTTHHATWRSL